jgi:hypothetical protein
MCDSRIVTHEDFCFDVNAVIRVKLNRRKSQSARRMLRGVFLKLRARFLSQRQLRENLFQTKIRRYAQSFPSPIVSCQTRLPDETVPILDFGFGFWISLVCFQSSFELIHYNQTAFRSIGTGNADKT